MAISLEYQSVYYQRDAVVKPLSLTFFAVGLLLIVLVLKVWIKVQIVDLGYEMAEVKKQSAILEQEVRELELQKSILLRADYLKAEGKKIGLTYLNPQQAINIEN